MPDALIKTAVGLAAASALAIVVVYLTRRVKRFTRAELSGAALFLTVGRDTEAPEVIIRELSAVASGYMTGGKPLEVGVVDLGLPLAERRAVLMLAEDLGNVVLLDASSFCAEIKKQDP